MRMVQPSQPVATEASAQRRVRRPTTRLRVYPQYQYEWVPDVYPRYNPGPNAVRDCNATYVQEFRPSGTVIVPRMSCFWRPGSCERRRVAPISPAPTTSADVP
jgi:hypothetical protein